MTKLRATLTAEYDVDPANYGTEDPRLIAEIEEQDTPDLAAVMHQLGPYSLTVEPVED